MKERNSSFGDRIGIRPISVAKYILFRKSRQLDSDVNYRPAAAHGGVSLVINSFSSSYFTDISPFTPYGYRVSRHSKQYSKMTTSETPNTTPDEGVTDSSLESSEKFAATSGRDPPKLSPMDEKVESSVNDAASTLSTEPETKVNFGFLPVPKNCRVSPTKPFHFNLAINLLFGFASTFTVLQLLSS
jgi:hypothetical protein